MFKLIAFAALIAVAYAQGEAYAQTTDLRNSPNQGDGSYSYAFQTSNGISQQEAGVGGQQAQGSSSYYAPNGELIQLSYVADGFGFRPVGNHLPVAPAIPDYILRSLEYIRTHPSAESQPGNFQPQQFGQQQRFF